MKYKSQHLNGPAPEIIVFPRADGNDIVFKITPVLDLDEFETIVPEIKPPPIMYAGGEKGFDTNNPEYIKKWTARNEQRVDWVFLKSIQDSADLEWETVDMSKPETWKNYKDELKEAGFTPIQILHLINRVFGANGVDEKKMQQARERFLASTPAPQDK